MYGTLPDGYGCCGKACAKCAGFGVLGAEPLYTNGSLAQDMLKDWAQASGTFTSALAASGGNYYVAGAAASIHHTILMVRSIQAQKLRKEDAAAFAQGMGLTGTEASSIQSYVLRALRWDEFKVDRKLQAAQKVYDRVAGRSLTRDKRTKRLGAVVNLLTAIKQVQQENRVAALQQSLTGRVVAPLPNLAVSASSPTSTSTPSVPSWLLLGLLVGGAGTALYVWNRT